MNSKHERYSLNSLYSVGITRRMPIILWGLVAWVACGGRRLVRWPATGVFVSHHCVNRLPPGTSASILPLVLPRTSRSSAIHATPASSMTRTPPRSPAPSSAASPFVVVVFSSPRVLVRSDVFAAAFDRRRVLVVVFVVGRRSSPVSLSSREIA